MASHAETAVNQAVQALVQRDHDLALRVKENDRVIDQFEVEIDELVIQLLTKAPLATNLRLVTVAMKISQNLERVGDEATKIAKRARDLSQEPPVKINLDLPRMAGLALDMVKAALDAFVNRDSAAARALIPRDKEVDALNKQIHAGPRAAHGRQSRHHRPLPATGWSPPKASNASPTTPRTWPRKSSISAKRRTSATPGRKHLIPPPPRPRQSANCANHREFQIEMTRYR